MSVSVRAYSQDRLTITGKGIMKEISHGLLSEATPEELLSCIRLLAISVVQHRAKNGFVTLRHSTEHLRATADENDASSVVMQSQAVLEEALEIARALAAEPTSTPVTPAEPGDPPPESRTQLRLNISSPIRVLWPHDSKPVQATLGDISWGGASIRVDEAKNDSGDTLRIFLPRPQGGLISIEAKVLRTWQNPDGDGNNIAVRFSSLSTRDEAKLEELLEHFVLATDQENQRKYAKLTQSLDLQFDDEQELLSTLESISAGGLGITVPEPAQIGQSLQIVISTLDESCFLKLRARVVRQEPLKMRSMTVYQVGLKFEHPSEELRKRTQELISSIAAKKK